MTVRNDVERYLTHEAVGVQTVAIGANALAKLSDVLPPLPPGAVVAVLADEVPYRGADGTDVKEAVLGTLDETARIRTVRLTGSVHADEVTVQAAIDGTQDASAVVTIGSGTMCDIGKVAAGHRPHVVIQSAASVNGFADDQSVILRNGVKRTVRSAWPHALVIDTDVLAGAPAELNRSGLGDMISMFTAPADWYLSSLFGMAHGWQCEAATMTRRYGGELLDLAAGVGRSEPAVLEELANFLTLSGFSMGVAGQTSPSSGMEHTVSHLLDMAKGAGGKEMSPHGAQVGVATVLVSTLWRRMTHRLAAGDLGPVRLPTADEAEARVTAAFAWLDDDGAIARECWADYSKKLAHLTRGDAGGRVEALVSQWGRHQTRLAELLGETEKITAALRNAGAARHFSELPAPSEAHTVRWALLNCHLMRNRFTITDLAFLTGCWDEAEVDAVLAEAAALGAGT